MNLYVKAAGGVALVVVASFVVMIADYEDKTSAQFVASFKFEPDNKYMTKEQKETTIRQRLEEIDTLYATLSKLRDQPSKPPSLTDEEWKETRAYFGQTLNSLKAQYEQAVKAARQFRYEVPKSKMIATPKND